MSAVPFKIEGFGDMSRNYSSLLDLAVLFTFFPPNCSCGASWQFWGSKENRHVRSNIDHRGVRQVASRREGERNQHRYTEEALHMGILRSCRTPDFVATVNLKIIEAVTV